MWHTPRDVELDVNADSLCGTGEVLAVISFLHRHVAGLQLVEPGYQRSKTGYDPDDIAPAGATKAVERVQRCAAVACRVASTTR